MTKEWKINDNPEWVAITAHAEAMERVRDLEAVLGKLIPRAAACARVAKNAGDVQLEVKIRDEVREAKAALGGAGEG